MHLSVPLSYSFSYILLKSSKFKHKPHPHKNVQWQTQINIIKSEEIAIIIPIQYTITNKNVGISEITIWNTYKLKLVFNIPFNKSTILFHKNKYIDINVEPDIKSTHFYPLNN